MTSVEFAQQEFKLKKQRVIQGYKDRNETLEDDFYEYDKMYEDAIIELLEVLSTQGHSGFSHNLTLSMFSRLADRQPLSPLTGEDDEWTEWSQEEWQDMPNRRNVRASGIYQNKGEEPFMSHYYVFCYEGEPYSGYTGSYSRKIIEFPFVVPKESVRIEFTKDEAIRLQDKDQPDEEYDKMHLAAIKKYEESII